jgi:broad specificity phosphatase PhoE
MSQHQTAPAEHMGRILLIRHGRTEENKKSYLGWRDIPLNPAGIEQARAVAVLLAGERIDAVYSSPLSRALETAGPLAEQRGLSVQVRDALKEINYGQCQGMLKSERKLKLRKQHLYLPLPGGESLFDVYQRVRRLLAELHADLIVMRHLAIVGHFWSNRMLVAAMYQLPFSEILGRPGYKPETGSVFEIVYRVDAGQAIRVVTMRWMDEQSKLGAR